MREWSTRDTWKHPGRDGYLGEEHDDLYLETLRAEQTDGKVDCESNVVPIVKKMPMKTIGAILTTPYSCLRAGLRIMFRKTGKHPHP